MEYSQEHLFGFYETPAWVAELIASHSSLKQRTQIIDLGAGQGALLKSFAKIHPKAFRTGLEVNPLHFDTLRNLSDELIDIDLLKQQIPSTIFKKGFQRTVVSNPPFGKIALDEKIKESLIMHGLIDPTSQSKNARLEAYFLSLALGVTKYGSSISFIVSSNLLYQRLWATLRGTLVTKHKLEKIILLPSDAYSDAEVESAVIFLRPYQGESENIEVVDYRDGRIQRKQCEAEKFVNAFFSELRPKSNQHQLGRVLQSIYRGRSCSKELKNNNIAHLHSSDINHLHKKKIRLPYSDKQSPGAREKIAEAGDILIARVGTRCLGSAIMIESGSSVISDSVISVRVPQDKREKVFDELTSDVGRDWLRSTARGSCAKIITYDSIQRFPIGAL